MSASVLAEERMKRRVEALRRLRDDLVLYSAETLKIKGKDGQLRPFIFNRAQRFLHERLEWQRTEKGWVRALVGKGRQGQSDRQAHHRCRDRPHGRTVETAMAVRGRNGR